jgi:hypothetical protein
MEPPVSEDVARGRFLVINVLRLGGVAMVIVGILVVERMFDLPDVAGYVLIGAGLIDIFLVPQMLARKWRSPLE